MRINVEERYTATILSQAEFQDKLELTPSRAAIFDEILTHQPEVIEDANAFLLEMINRQYLTFEPFIDEDQPTSLALDNYARELHNFIMMLFFSKNEVIQKQQRLFLFKILYILLKENYEVIEEAKKAPKNFQPELFLLPTLDKVLNKIELPSAEPEEQQLAVGD